MSGSVPSFRSIAGVEFFIIIIVYIIIRRPQQMITINR
jgi:hypothetical protein